MRLAVIPARGGSKRIVDKNIKYFGGKPLIAWSIEAAIACKCFEKIIAVDGNSTDGTVEYLLSQGVEVIKQNQPTF